MIVTAHSGVCFLFVFIFINRLLGLWGWLCRVENMKTFLKDSSSMQEEPTFKSNVNGTLLETHLRATFGLLYVDTPSTVIHCHQIHNLALFPYNYVVDKHRDRHQAINILTMLCLNRSVIVNLQGVLKATRTIKNGNWWESISTGNDWPTAHLRRTY